VKVNPFFSTKQCPLWCFPAVAALAVLHAVAWSAPALAEDAARHQVLLREEFDTLDQWKPLKFRKIDNMSTYTVERQGNGDRYVRAQSSSSASGMVWQGQFNVYDHPRIRWRWKVSNALERSGDDYPMRIYVMFKYDPGDPKVRKKFKYGLAKLLYGEYPPYRSLNYIWSNREHGQPYIPNPFAKEAVMAPLRAGPELTGKWLEEERDILADYREAFGEDPPAMAGLAFMNDSDNTGESSESWLDWIQIFRPSENLEENGELIMENVQD
jgi:hypothetical protein